MGQMATNGGAARTDAVRRVAVLSTGRQDYGILRSLLQRSLE